MKTFAILLLICCVAEFIYFYIKTSKQIGCYSLELYGVASFAFAIGGLLVMLFEDVF